MCIPTIINLQLDKGKGKETEPSSYNQSASCELQFHFEQLVNERDAESLPPTGFCWSGLFRNPVLVAGYPIPHRDKAGTGLEVSLSFISLLMQSKEVFRLNDSIVIKGFCCLLVAVEAAKDVILWHLLHNPSGDRISFYDPRLESTSKVVPHDLTLKDMGTRRHIVGWCDDVMEYTGKLIMSSSLLRRWY